MFLRKYFVAVFKEQKQCILEKAVVDYLMVFPTTLQRSVSVSHFYFMELEDMKGTHTYTHIHNYRDRNTETHNSDTDIENHINKRSDRKKAQSSPMKKKSKHLKGQL